MPLSIANSLLVLAFALAAVDARAAHTPPPEKPAATYPFTFDTLLAEAKKTGRHGLFAATQQPAGRSRQAQSGAVPQHSVQPRRRYLACRGAAVSPRAAAGAAQSADDHHDLHRRARHGDGCRADAGHVRDVADAAGATGEGVVSALGLSSSQPHQLQEDLGRISGIPGRELLPRRRPESPLRLCRRAALPSTPPNLPARNFRYSRTFGSNGRAPMRTRIVIYALLESESTTGAYRFTVQPGVETLTDVDLTLFPRAEMRVVGIAPLTSMFLFDETNRGRLDDYRPEVHDSDGLQIESKSGEHIFRQLANPIKLQVSTFTTQAPQGFGLVQRSRQQSDFQDFDAQYERRPSAWVEPKGDWGAGARRAGRDSFRPRDQRQHRGILAPHAILDAGPSGALRLPHRLVRRASIAEVPGQNPSPPAPAPVSTASGASSCWISSAQARRSTACIWICPHRPAESPMPH